MPIDTKVILAPLSGVSDLSFRLICREQGAKLCFFEMADANMLTHAASKNRDIFKTTPEDQPIAAQILGSDPDVTLAAAEKLLELTKPQFLDINAACPAKKVVKKKAGAHLIREPKVLEAIIKKLTDNLSLPITVKLRIGYNTYNAAEIKEVAKMCQGGGAAMLFVHGRTWKHAYCGDVTYEGIRAIKEAVKIPVYGSGSVFSPELAKKMLDETGCDGVMVARGAMGNPWIFKSIEEYLKSGQLLPEPTPKERMKMCKRHLSYMEEYKESRQTNKIGWMRRIAIYYIKNLPGAAAMRHEVTSAKSYEELMGVVDKI